MCIRDRYRRAYFDDGTPLGSRENPECQIDSLAQSWSVISDATRVKDNGNYEEAKKRGIEFYSERAIEAMDAVTNNLVKKDKSMILSLIHILCIL